MASSRCSCLVSGSRYFKDYGVLCSQLDAVRGRFTKLIFGDCYGTDNLALRYAREHNIPYAMYGADWERYGLRAGPLRNMEMIDNEKPAIGIFFVAKNSKGTVQALNYAKDRIPEIIVVNV